jgi:hypothetical protein
MDLSRLNRGRVLAGAIASVLLVIAILFLPWYSVDLSIPSRVPGPEFDADTFICGSGEDSCTGFETFPILRWLLLLAAIAPLILAYILVRGHKLSYPPGEMTMIAGFAAFVLIAYNGIIDPPGSGNQEIGITKEIGYYVALFSALGIAAAGTGRAMETTKDAPRKAPGTV